MISDESHKNRFCKLRKKALEILANSGKVIYKKDQYDLLTAIEELNTYHVELEMQNNELLETQHRLGCSQKYNKYLFEYAPIGYLVLDIKGFIKDSNIKATLYFDYPANILIGQRLLSFIPPDYFSDFMKNWNSFMEEQTPVSIELQFYKRTKERFWCRIDLEWASDINEDNEKMVLCSLLDITKERMAQLYLQEKQAQLAHAGRLASLGEMASGVAHELNQPLTIIKLTVDSLKLLAQNNVREPETFLKKFHEELVSIQEEVTRASEFIENMRNYARYDDHCSEINLLESLNRGLTFFKEQFRNHDIALEILVDENLPPIVFNSRKFEQIVVNLLSNARYAVDHKEEKIKSSQITTETPYKKTVKIRMLHIKDKRVVVLEIEDNGIGMGEMEKNRCMDAFFTTKQVGQGTGLGLSIVNSILKEFKCSIEIESKKNIGTKIRITIPEKTKLL